MDLFQQLNQAIDEEYHHGELPDELVAPLRQVSQNSTQFSNHLSTVEILLKQIKAFEPYCDCGCFAEGFNAKDVKKTLKQLWMTTDGSNVEIK